MEFSHEYSGGMKRRWCTHSNTRWPFWLLIAAWICANSPQAATYAVITWIGEARHFTHQQRLTAEVAQVLTGAKVLEAPAVTVGEPVRPFAPPVPVEATLKKIELSTEGTVELSPLAARKKVRVVRATVWPERRREAPPCEPPRVG